MKAIKFAIEDKKLISETVPQETLTYHSVGSKKPHKIDDLFYRY